MSHTNRPRKHNDVHTYSPTQPHTHPHPHNDIATHYYILYACTCTCTCGHSHIYIIYTCTMNISLQLSAYRTVTERICCSVWIAALYTGPVLLRYIQVLCCCATGPVLLRYRSCVAALQVLCCCLCRLRVQNLWNWVPLSEPIAEVVLLCILLCFQCIHTRISNFRQIHVKASAILMFLGTDYFWTCPYLCGRSAE